MPADATLRRALDGGQVYAPLVLNPLMAKYAEAAGFKAGYVGGGALGFLNGGLEANLGLEEMVRTGVSIRAQSGIHLIMDGTCGWGDPVHLRHVIPHAEAAGYDAIEIEDQVLPKRVHHHAGIEHLVPIELMVGKIEQAVAARRSREFLVIARTNGVRATDRDDAMRRAEAYARAGADILLPMARSAEDLRYFAERLPAPLMYLVPLGGLGEMSLSLDEMAALGYGLIGDPATPIFAMARALRAAYAALARRERDPTVGGDGAVEERRIYELLDLEALLEIERRTHGIRR
ncbi:MAG: isocitrate lyase/PEP mutase family protein [Alphaproteobacteria bacterium]|nr:isocitrate lyase/PEP mutase family protein [Alphaproteobacteria bacterium]